MWFLAISQNFEPRNFGAIWCSICYGNWYLSFLLHARDHALKTAKLAFFCLLQCYLEITTAKIESIFLTFAKVARIRMEQYWKHRCTVTGVWIILVVPPIWIIVCSSFREIHEKLEFNFQFITVMSLSCIPRSILCLIVFGIVLNCISAPRLR